MGILVRPAGLLFMLATLLGLTGCGGKAEPRVPPSELASFEASRALDTIWSVSMDDAGIGRFEPLLTPTSVTVADADGKVRRLDRDTGEALWRIDTDRALISGVGGDDRTVYVAGRDGALLALDGANGEERWRTVVSSEVLTPVAVGFGALLVRSADGRLVALDPIDGAERWSSSWTPPALTINGYSQPLLLEGGVLVGLDDGRLLALDLANGRTIWETEVSRPSGRSEVERLADIDADVIIDDTGIYAVSFQGNLARIEPARGQRLWSVAMSSTAGIAQDADALYVVDDDGTVHAIDKADGRTLWRQDDLRGRRPSAPARIGDTLVVGDFEGYVHVLDPNDGQALARRRPAKSAIRARPVGDAAGFVVQSTGGRVAALRLAGT